MIPETAPYGPGVVQLTWSCDFFLISCGYGGIYPFDLCSIAVGLIWKRTISSSWSSMFLVSRFPVSKNPPNMSPHVLVHSQYFRHQFLPATMLRNISFWAILNNLFFFIMKRWYINYFTIAKVRLVFYLWYLRAIWAKNTATKGSFFQGTRFGNFRNFFIKARINMQKKKCFSIFTLLQKIIKYALEYT